MQTNPTNTGGDIYRSKLGMVLVINPTHGTAGWRRMPESDVREELMFVSRPMGPLTGGWVTADEFRKALHQKKQSNYEFYKSHPALLREKIRGPRSGRSAFSAPGFVR